jgi:basic membrane protein A
MDTARFRWLFIVIVVLSLVAAACGDDDGDDASTSPGATTKATVAGSQESQPDVNGDGKVVIGVMSPGDTNDNGYYESFVTAARDFAKKEGWTITVVDKINPADAVAQARNLCRQKVDMVAVAASELKDAIPVAAEPVCKATNWYVAGGQGVDQTKYFAQSTDDVNQTLYVAGVAAGELMKARNVKKAGFITGPELDFAKAAAKAFEVGIKSVVSDATVVSTFTGDFDDSAKGKEAANAQFSQGVGLVYPYLGGATDAVAILANEKNIPVLTPGTDRCTGTPKYDVSVIFSPGDFFAAALRDFADGNMKLGETRVWKMGVDPVPTVKICNPTGDQQKAVDQVIADIGTGKLDPKAKVEAAS